MLNIAFGEVIMKKHLATDQTGQPIWPTAIFNVARGTAPGIGITQNTIGHRP